VLTYTVDIHYKNLLVFFALEPENNTDSELSSQNNEEEDHDDLPDLIDGINHLNFDFDILHQLVNDHTDNTNIIVAHQTFNLSYTTIQHVDDLIIIAHPDLPTAITRVESLSSNSFKFGIKRFPWGVHSQYINSIPVGGYGITVAHYVEVIVLSDITVDFGSGLIVDPIVEDTEEEAVYTLTRVNPLPYSCSNNFWE